MLDKNSSRLEHAVQNILLLALSAVTLPYSTLLLFLNYVFLRNTPAIHRKGPRRTILITGVGMTKGLALARHFHVAGHRVIGADFSSLSCGRVSRSLAAFYVPTKPSEDAGSAQYIFDLLRIIKLERVDLWVSCSGVASAVQDGEAKEAIENTTKCKCIQFDVEQTSTLHAKDTFIAHVQSLDLTVPETHVVRNRDEVLKHLPLSIESGKGESTQKHFILKPIGMDDSSRGDINTLLPRPTSTETTRHLQSLNITSTNPFILQQFIKGREYCTHALVIRGSVKVFCACPSSDMLMHYELLPATSALSRAMLAFTRRVAEEGGESFTGHLSFDFLVEEDDVLAAEDDGKTPTLYPIECNPRAHTAVALWRSQTTEAMVDAYLSLLEPGMSQDAKAMLELNGHNGNGNGALVNGVAEAAPVYPTSTQTKVYWFGHDLVTRLVLPFYHVVIGRIGIFTALGKLVEFIDHVLYWHDGTWEAWDPLPAWWLYHVYWPSQFAWSLWQGVRWSRVNVSTTKMFVC